jgi:DNA polymerase III epsilon subunit-like protein
MTPPAPRPLPDLLVVVDTETNGFPAVRPGCPVRAITLGLASYAREAPGADGAPGRWAQLGRFHRMIAPPCWPAEKVAAGAEEVHGIPRARVYAEGRPAAEVWAELVGALGLWVSQVQARGVWAPTVGYFAWNASFDWTMLRRLAADAGVPVGGLVFLDVRLTAALTAPHGCLMMAWERRSTGPKKSKSLDSARKALGLPERTGHHDAADDARLAGDVLLAMLG